MVHLVVEFCLGKVGRGNLQKVGSGDCHFTAVCLSQQAGKRVRKGTAKRDQSAEKIGEMHMNSVLRSYVGIVTCL